jgi:uncharacterized repeat protein (TIGR01451 family)
VTVPIRASALPNRPKLQKFAASGLVLSLLAAQVIPAFATIDNTATASGTYNGSSFNSNTSTVNVPVAPETPGLSITKTAGAPSTANGTDATIVDAGDTITYTYQVTNTGNVSLTNVVPTDAGPTFNGNSAAGTLGSFSPASASLAPGAAQSFTATYTLTQLDVDRAAGLTNAVVNTAGADGKTPGNVTYSIPAGSRATASTTIPAGPKLSIVKSYVLADNGTGTAGKADLGEAITYTYTVTNVGNVAMTNITISDSHPGVSFSPGDIKNETLVTEGPMAPGTVSTDAANNGSWDVLQPGATVKFTWVHIVTQAEIDGG